MNSKEGDILVALFFIPQILLAESGPDNARLLKGQVPIGPETDAPLAQVLSVFYDCKYDHYDVFQSSGCASSKQLVGTMKCKPKPIYQGPEELIVKVACQGTSQPSVSECLKDESVKWERWTGLPSEPQNGAAVR